MDPEARVVVTATDATGAAFASANGKLQTLVRGVRQFRSVLSGFGVALSGRALASWMSSALDVKKLTAEQIENTKAAREAFDSYKQASDSLARSLATVLAPAIRNVAISFAAIKEAFDPSSSQFGRSADVAREQLDRQLEEVERLQRLLNTQQNYTANANWFQRMLFGDNANNVQETTSQIAAARLEVERLRKVWADAMGAAPKDDLQEISNVLVKMPADLRKLPPEFAAFVASVKKGKDELREISGTVAKMPAELKQLSPEFNAFAANLRATAKDAKDNFSDFAESIGRGLHDSLVDAFMGIEVSFKDLLKRMAAEFAASAIFSGLASFFPAGGFLSKFFGGFRANGGPVSAGRGYVVGERGPEMFVPGMSGSIVPAGGGSIVIHQTNTFHGGDQRQQAAAIAANNARLKQEIKAEISDSRRRGRPI